MVAVKFNPFDRVLAGIKGLGEEVEIEEALMTQVVNGFCMVRLEGVFGGGENGSGSNERELLGPVLGEFALIVVVNDGAENLRAGGVSQHVVEL